ncbi:class I SAM-dependent methyltransferase [Paenibacillus ginsengarvi]|uniref:Class I SAM-dependent methyltransferase n=1 Tax=Paenibacillus ginsengarvi TaxID=400777 RepID=A0A3B0CRF5_9BACL|nr:class I SAM-dependent methyltransferase [Paenibacillus ginsengarvi]RKN86578.1 class I SAM-dependent methyltransferase [Paenibacillus ginsengarvi]
MKKYYLDEHTAAYAEMKERGIAAWDQYYDPDSYSFDRFMMRPFLEQALETAAIGGVGRALEYGCGTGAASCFLARCGFEVEGIDITPDAIELARRYALERNLNVAYAVRDITQCRFAEPVFDLVVDNYCMQSIVTDEDRDSLFAAVRSGLKNGGYYIVATAMYHSGRDYGDGYYDSEKGIVYEKLEADPALFSDTLYRDGGYWLPHRRHLTADALRAELQRAGFSIVYQQEGNVICKLSSVSDRHL